MKLNIKTYAYGFPRLGENKEYKFLLENFWKQKISVEEFCLQLVKLQQNNEAIYQHTVDYAPTGEMTLYDKMLDMAMILGVYNCEQIWDYYKFCFGEKALELKKWFNTNYHYLVVDFSKANKEFKLNFENSIFKSFYNKNDLAYFIGPFTFLKLSKNIKYLEDKIEQIADVYSKLLSNFESVHLDEPAFVLDLNKTQVNLIKKLYKNITEKTKVKIFVFTYYESVSFLKELYDISIFAIGLDFVNGLENFEVIRKYGFPKDKILIAGIIDGKSVFKTNWAEVCDKYNVLRKYVKEDKIIISNGAPLYHLPFSVNKEKEEIKKNFCFALEKLFDLQFLKGNFNNILINNKSNNLSNFNLNQKENRKIRIFKVDFKRNKRYSSRIKLQRKLFNLPLFPTTTIGSFPQTSELRKIRKDFKLGKISEKEYKEFVKSKIKEAIDLQERFKLDILVHGEFERGDMVEFFAEEFSNFLTTENGWVISYGSRIYKPPIVISENVTKKSNVTKEFILFAKSLTDKPIKAIYTGPITILKWSFVDKSLDFEKLLYNIASCIKKDIKEFINYGIKMIQIDEPALIESLPLKEKNMRYYLKLFERSFNYIVKDLKEDIQVHLHVCYSNYLIIKKLIAKLECDVVSLETARSGGEIFNALSFKDIKRDIGVGVWDVHSHEVPNFLQMRAIVDKALKKFPASKIWINPDCGLKTRSWQEIEIAIEIMSKLAESLRKNLKGRKQI